MYDIFLSYSSQDRERLQPLFQALGQQGWSVFWDHRTIEIGDQWGKKIDRAIRTSKCVVVVWSKASVDSEWVQEEANIGKQRDVLLPIRIDEVIFPVGFTMRQTGDFVHWDGDANDPQFIRLAGKIRELVGQHDAGEAQRKAEATAEQERLAQEKAAAEQQACEQAEQQRRLAEEARLRSEAAAAAERERLAKEKELAQQRAAEQKAREEAERQAKAREEQLKREQAAAEEKARKEAAHQTKTNQKPPHKPFPWLPSLLISAVVLGWGGIYWQRLGESRAAVLGHYTINGDGTVTDTKAGLMWKQCSEGQIGADCSGGTVAAYKWDDVMAKFGKNKNVSFAGHSDWRMPTNDELRTLVYCSNGTPQETAWDKGCGDNYQSPTIDLKAFPNTPGYAYWSFTEKDASYAWVVDFHDGNGAGYDRYGGYAFAVRLVRSGQ